MFSKYWDLKKYQSQNTSQRRSDNGGDYEQGDVSKLDKAVRSPMFWSIMGLVEHLGFASEFLGRFCEGCPCHEFELTHSRNRCRRLKCQLKGCRAPELASGCAIQHFEKVFSRTRQQFLSCTVDLPNSARQALVDDYERARGKSLSELMLKLGHWRLLPHALCGLGHYDERKALLAAQHVLKLWDQGGPGCAHAQSRRFLQPEWSGFDGTEKPLRVYVP